MNKWFVVGLLTFAVVVIAYAGFFVAGVAPPDAPVFYHYRLKPLANGLAAADLLSLLLAYVFVFIGSSLFFGLGTPFALGLEAAKYSSLFLSGRTLPFDAVFAIPALIAAYSANLLNEGVLEDYEHSGTVFKNVELSVVLLLAGLAMLVALYFVRAALVG